MRHFTGLALSALLGLTGAAGFAAPVSESLRPQARPAVQQGAPAAVTPVAAGALNLALIATRPQARPATLNTEAAPEVVYAANPGFDRWLAEFRARALQNGISAKVYDQAVRGVRYNPLVIEKDRYQSEFVKQIWDYLDSATNPVRVADGQKAMRQQARVLEAVERAYGVDKEIVAAIWGVESTFGTRRGDIDVIEALATLSYDGRRGAFFQKQLIAALQILQRGDVTPRNMKGSWAGAMGHTQFIPTSYLAYAVDITGDGKADIWSDNPADSLASTAAYLKRHGWIKGMPWGVEVRAPRGAAVGSKRMPSQWAAAGVVGMDGRAVPDYGSATLWQPAGANGPSFLLFKNFDVLLRYNNAKSYATAVGHLADRLAGKPPIQAPWPRGYTPVTFEQKKEIQRLLKRKGYPVEKIDGLIGPNTSDAIKAFQRARGVKADGYASAATLRLLKGR